MNISQFIDEDNDYPPETRNSSIFIKLLFKDIRKCSKWYEKDEWRPIKTAIHNCYKLLQKGYVPENQGELENNITILEKLIKDPSSKKSNVEKMSEEVVQNIFDKIIINLNDSSNSNNNNINKINDKQRASKSTKNIFNLNNKYSKRQIKEYKSKDNIKKENGDDFVKIKLNKNILSLSENYISRLTNFKDLLIEEEKQKRKYFNKNDYGCKSFKEKYKYLNSKYFD